jgi:gluconokinase
MVIVITGPAGAGKTTVGKRLADALGWAFHDADDFHPPGSVTRMSAGLPLTSADRLPWLSALRDLVGRLVREGLPAVLACSALKEEYRRLLLPPDAEPGEVRFVYLRASRALLARRLATRGGHFFPMELLASQFDDLEEPAGNEPAPVLVLDAEAPVERLVREIRLAADV